MTKNEKTIRESEIEFLKIAIEHNFTMEEITKTLRRTKSYVTRRINEIKKEKSKP